MPCSHRDTHSRVTVGWPDTFPSSSASWDCDQPARERSSRMRCLWSGGQHCRLGHWIGHPLRWIGSLVDASCRDARSSCWHVTGHWLRVSEALRDRARERLRGRREGRIRFGPRCPQGTRDRCRPRRRDDGFRGRGAAEVGEVGWATSGQSAGFLARAVEPSRSCLPNFGWPCYLA